MQSRGNSNIQPLASLFVICAPMVMMLECDPRQQAASLSNHLQANRSTCEQPTSGCLTMPRLRASQVKSAFRLVSMPRPMPSSTMRSTPCAIAFSSGGTCEHMLLSISPQAPACHAFNESGIVVSCLLTELVTCMAASWMLVAVRAVDPTSKQGGFSNGRDG